jgi:hypothetical protein
MALNPAAWFSQDTWDALDKFGILLGDLMLALTLAGAVIGFLRREDILRSLIRGISRVRQPTVSFDPVERETWDAIAFTVSHAEVPIRVLDRHLEAGRVGLLFSEQSRPAADAIKRFLLERGKPAPEEQVLHNPDDPAEARRKALYLLDGWRGAGLARLAVDVTGGKTPMSLGAFLAAREAGASTLYVTSDYDKLRKPDLDTAVVRCISHPD